MLNRRGTTIFAKVATQISVPSAVVLGWGSLRNNIRQGPRQDVLSAPQYRTKFLKRNALTRAFNKGEVKLELSGQEPTQFKSKLDFKQHFKAEP